MSSSISFASLRGSLGADKYVPPPRRAAAVAAATSTVNATSTSSTATPCADGSPDAAAAAPPAAAVPSRILHWTRVTADISERDLVSLVVAFGTVLRVLMIRSKFQAFLELSSVAAASAALERFATAPPMIRGRRLAVQFSTHQELTIADDGSLSTFASASASNASNPSAAAFAAALASSAPREGPGPVVLLSFRDLTCSITVDMLVPALRAYGPPRRALVFERSSLAQALVEYGSAETAAVAARCLNGQSLFRGACCIEAQCSKLPRLRIKSEGPMSRDFVRFPLPPSGLLDHLLAAPACADGASAAAASAAAAASVVAASVVAGCGSDGDSSAGSLDLEAFADAPVFVPACEQPPAPSSLLRISPCPPTAAQTLHLLSCFGNVHRVLVTPVAPAACAVGAVPLGACALVAMESAAAAERALEMLSGVRLGAVPVSVALVPVSETAPHVAVATSGAAVDFSASTLNRFRVEPEKNGRHITRPSALLHVSNISYGVDEAAVAALCGGFGVLDECKLFVHRGRRQALVRFADAGVATVALAALHDREVDGRALRVAFSDS